MSGYQSANAPYQIPPQVLQALMQHLQQQQLAQNAAARAPMQTGATSGPMPAATPPTMPGQTAQQGNTPTAGSQPINITGGGQPIMITAGVQGQVPFGGQGVTAPQPRAFSGAPGGQHAHGGGNPFSISPNPQGPYAGTGGSGGGAGGGYNMDAFGNYYTGTDPSATNQQTIKNAGQLLQNLNPDISGS
jgi:hypothetical protein